MTRQLFVKHFLLISATKFQATSSEGTPEGQYPWPLAGYPWASRLRHSANRAKVALATTAENAHFVRHSKDSRTLQYGVSA